MNTIKMKLLPILLLLPYLVFSQNEYFEKGKEKHSQQNWNEAMAYYEVALDHDPTHEKALFNHALCAKELNKMTVVKRDINKILSINPNNLEAIDWKGCIAMIEGRWQDAIYEFTTVLKNEDAFEVRLNRAISYLENNQLDLCYEDLALCKKRQNNDDRVNATFGDYHLKKENLTEAFTAYKKSLDANPDNAMVLNNCGILSINKQDFDAAIKYFERAIELEPRSDIFSHLAMAFIEKENLSSAAKYAHLALAKDLKESRAHFALGMINFKNGIYEEAVEDFDMAIEFEPNYNEALLMRAKASIELDMTLAAKHDLKKLLSLESNNKEANRLLKNLKD